MIELIESYKFKCFAYNFLLNHDAAKGIAQSCQCNQILCMQASSTD